MTKPTRRREGPTKRLFAAFALAALALTTLAGGASATHSLGGGPTNQDLASGHAHWEEPPYGEKHCNPGALEKGQSGCWNADYQVNATSDPDGQNPRGHFFLQVDRPQPRGNYYARGDVICLRVEGNRAIIGGVVTEARNAEDTDLKGPDDPRNEDGRGSATLMEVIDLGGPGEDWVSMWVIHGDLRPESGIPFTGPTRSQWKQLKDCPFSSVSDVTHRGNFVVHDASQS